MPAPMKLNWSSHTILSTSIRLGLAARPGTSAPRRPVFRPRRRRRHDREVKRDEGADRLRLYSGREAGRGSRE
jgi:hypothetical protein